ncbi:MAG: nuclear transport factor 2 family protein [Gammaproteobacteria bacterium]|nr:nuclear transport factor 2 family protein [Gammaproteobacteria bacterium]
MKIIYLWSIVILSFTWVSTAYCESTQVDKQVFENLYANFKSAIKNKDETALQASLAPDFVSEDISGNTKSSQQMIAEISNLPNDPNKISKTTILSVSIKGNTAKITQKYKMNTLKISSNGNLMPAQLIAISDDTWTKSHGIWLMKKTVTKQLDYSLGNQIIMHKVHS